jgi:glycosyltransferase involved in cell wall biosynthesis
VTPLRIIEPNLRHPSHHYAEFVRALGARRPANAGAVEVLAHPDADRLLASMPGVSPVTDPPRMDAPWAEWRAIARALRRPDPFLVLTADGRHAMAVHLLSAGAPEPPVQARLYFHWLERSAVRLAMLRAATRARRYALAVTPTGAIAEAMRALGWRRVVHVPYPALAPDVPPAPAPFARVLMAGAARMNKGLDLVAALAQRWAAAGRPTPLFVQASMKHAARHGRRETAVVGALLASGCPGLVADARALDRAEYAERFRGALVLAPYERERFAEAVSGVVLDALLHGAPVVATAGTWPGRQVERFGAGMLLAERSADALEAAIDAVLRDWDGCSARACAAARALAAEHDPANLLRVLMGEGVAT